MMYTQGSTALPQNSTIVSIECSDNGDHDLQATFTAFDDTQALFLLSLSSPIGCLTVRDTFVEAMDFFFIEVVFFFI